MTPGRWRPVHRTRAPPGCASEPPTAAYTSRRAKNLIFFLLYCTSLARYREGGQTNKGRVRGVGEGAKGKETPGAESDAARPQLADGSSLTAVRQSSARSVARCRVSASPLSPSPSVPAIKIAAREGEGGSALVRTLPPIRFPSPPLSASPVS
jgi:hypothetical protein